MFLCSNVVAIGVFDRIESVAPSVIARCGVFASVQSPARARERVNEPNASQPSSAQARPAKRRTQPERLTPHPRTRTRTHSSMGIKGLTGLINDHAPEAIKQAEIKTLFGRKVAIDA